MSKISDAIFRGASGERYHFETYSLGTRFSNIGAVYVFSRRRISGEGKGKHRVLYIGEAGELNDRIAYHEKWPCLERYSVNCICIHPEKDAEARLRKEADLLHAIETLCNDEL